MDDPVTVALNGQINPDQVGGTESSVMSAAWHLGCGRKDVTLKFLSIPHLADAVRAAGPKEMDLIEWPFPMSLPVLPMVHSKRWVRIRSWLGPAKPLFDRAVLTRRRMTQPKLPSAAECDHLLRQHGVEVIHFGWPTTFPTKLPFIYEPQDLQHRHYPEFFPKDVLNWRDTIYGAGCLNASFVVCGTWWTKNDIIEQFGVPSERIAVIPRYSVRGRADVSQARADKIVKHLNLPDSFAFYPAVTFPHKNHRRLVEAIRYLRDTGGPRVNIICTGRNLQPTYGEIEKVIRRYGLEDRIRFLGTVSEEVLTVLFARASFIVFPSLFEGLSQSLLEGLNFGLPVVGAKQTSIPETVGEAGLFFDGEDVQSIAISLAEAVGQPNKLAAMSRAARKEMERYDWGRAAETFVAAYRKAAGRKLTTRQAGLLEAATG